MSSTETQSLSIRRYHGVDGVHLWFSGVIDEHFPADAFANTHGVIVVDLGGIKRITSFGIREWCRALTTFDTGQLYFAEVADCMVPQFAMVAGFSGGGQILSYLEPYECDECGANAKRSFDRRVDPDDIWNGEPPDMPCATCGKTMHFADISESTRIALMLGGPLRIDPKLTDVEAGGKQAAKKEEGAPAPVAAQSSAKLRLTDATGARAKPGGGAPVAWSYPFEVNKQVVGEATVLWISGVLDAIAGFRHVDDGLEGTTVIAAPRILSCDDAGIVVLRKTVAAATANGGRVLFARCAPTLVSALARSTDSHGGLSLVSVENVISCPRCAIDAPYFVTNDSNGNRGTFCPRCGTACTVANDVLLQAIDQMPCAPTPTWLPPLLANLPQKIETHVPKAPRPKWIPAAAALSVVLIAFIAVSAYMLSSGKKKKLPFDPTIAAEPAPEEATPDEPAAVLPSLTSVTPRAQPVTKKKVAATKVPDGGSAVAVAPPAETTPPPKPRDARKLGDSLEGKHIGELDSADDQPALASQLTKAQLDASMSAVTSGVRDCYAQYHVAGTLPVRGTVAPTGRMQGGVVTGILAGTPTGQCVEKAVKRASFPRFSGASMSVSYSYTLP